MVQIRTVIEEDCVTKIIDDLIKTYPRVEELWEGWKWRLARDPITDATIVGDSHMIIKTSSGQFDYNQNLGFVNYR